MGHNRFYNGPERRVPLDKAAPEPVSTRPRVLTALPPEELKPEEEAAVRKALEAATRKRGG
ncbi:MAG TPA: hypothetical protein VEY30_08840 [Myxococcaceae bacterium]|nr:hypothetical protein [Myxococcaceae bacterium]